MDTPRFRKKDPPGRDGWELTFADMMTLILCFFIVVAAISEVDKVRFSKVADSMVEAMGKKETPVPKEETSVPSEWRQKLKSLNEVMAELESGVGREIHAVDLEMRPDAVAVNLRGTVFFSLGSADLTPKALDLLGIITQPLLDIPYKITVEGHSDNIPIQSTQFPSNWELSSARASAVARYLIEQGFPKEKIQVVGLADTRPLVPNLDDNGDPIPENQARNRRIVILVAP
ncbi:MAG: flagellar motor protein MotB [Thermodesulfobacteriota bacterium]|nr:flagellar motor protein MotB [Thermodesulfobacteriota bacterium]